MPPPFRFNILSLHFHISQTALLEERMRADLRCLLEPHVIK